MLTDSWEIGQGSRCDPPHACCSMWCGLRRTGCTAAQPLPLFPKRDRSRLGVGFFFLHFFFLLLMSPLALGHHDGTTSVGLRREKLGCSSCESRCVPKDMMAQLWGRNCVYGQRRAWLRRLKGKGLEGFPTTINMHVSPAWMPGTQPTPSKFSR